jgi:hypothetical protein
MLPMERALHSMDQAPEEPFGVGTSAGAEPWFVYGIDPAPGLIRHCCAAHRRETIVFGRRIVARMKRLYAFLVWRNFIKGRSALG